jgi:acyl-CoA reductase-like NAD-dependent aldehyde dehydrogenase
MRQVPSSARCRPVGRVASAGRRTAAVESRGCSGPQCHRRPGRPCSPAAGSAHATLNSRTSPSPTRRIQGTGSEGTGMTSAKSLVHHQRAKATPSFGLWIDGQARQAASGRTFECTDPFDSSVSGRFANGDTQDADAAVRSARRAFDQGSWASSPSRLRERILSRAANLVADNSAAFVDRMVYESGKPLSVARAEVENTVKALEYHAGLALDLNGQAATRQQPDAWGLVIKEPVGVAGMITPWNFPLFNPVIKVAPALAAGCTVVLKPSHLCPGPSMLLARFLDEAGLPSGVFNVVTSDLEEGAEVGQLLVRSPLVDKIAFTGSSITGAKVMESAARTLKRVSLELGGKSANIVFNDGPLEEAATVSARAFCFNSGQQCSAATRLLVQEDIHDVFVGRLLDCLRNEVVGDPADVATTMGPIVSPKQFERVQGYLDIGKEEAKLVSAHPAEVRVDLRGSLFVEPAVFTGVHSSSRIAQEEIFGPVLSVITFRSEDDAIQIANDSRYGLAGGVWSGVLEKAIRVASQVRSGKMFINCYNNSGLDHLPSGGYKYSGIGREDGRAGLEEYLETKTLHIRFSNCGS